MNATLQQLQGRIALALRGLDSTQTQLRPPSHPDKWSIQQIIEHLLLTYSGAEAALNTRLAKGRPTRATSSLLQKIQRYAVIRAGYFPYGRTAPAPVTPSDTGHPLSGAELTYAAVEYLAHLDHLCSEAGDMFGIATPCASHNVLGPLSVNQWRRFQLVHGKHHLKHILAIRKAHRL